MKAIQVKQPGGPEALEFVDLPIPQPKSREAVVKIAASGVNFIDVNLREGRYKVPLPFVVGQEAAGVVSSVGSEVKLVKSGDRVAWSGILGSYAAERERSICCGRYVAGYDSPLFVLRHVSAEAR